MQRNRQECVTAAAIARRAGVGRAAVSNWRRRYPDFPQPIEDNGGGSLFAWDDVRDWLIATGKAEQLAETGRTDTGTRRVDDVAPPEVDGHAVLGRRHAPAPQVAVPRLARVMASLLPLPDDSASWADPDVLDVPDPSIVVDPACAEGHRLLAVADRFADRFADHVTLIGFEADEQAVAEAAAGLRGHPCTPSYALYPVDELSDGNLPRWIGAAAGVLCRSPAGPPGWSASVPDLVSASSGDVESAWIRHCLALLRPGGTAVVALPPSAGTRASGRETRAALVRSGTLRDVIALPSGLGPDTELHLWVLQRPYLDLDAGPVRMVGLAGAGPDDVPDDAGAWELLHLTSDPSVVRSVSRLELLDGGVELLPARHLSSSYAGLPADLAGLTARVRSLYAGIGEAFPVTRAAPPRREQQTVTLAELERAGALTIRPRDAATHPGDVLVRTLGRPAIVADGSPGEGNGVAQVVEIDKEMLDPHFVAIFLRADSAALPVSNTHGALSRDDLRRCRLPRMSFDDQRRYGDAFRHVLDLQDVLAALATTSTNLLDQTLHGLTTGALLPTATLPRGTIVTEPNESET